MKKLVSKVFSVDSAASKTPGKRSGAVTNVQLYKGVVISRNKHTHAPSTMPVRMPRHLNYPSTLQTSNLMFESTVESSRDKSEAAQSYARAQLRVTRTNWWVTHVLACAGRRFCLKTDPQCKTKPANKVSNDNNMVSNECWQRWLFTPFLANFHKYVVPYELSLVLKLWTRRRLLLIC